MTDPSTALSPPIQVEPPVARHRDVALVAGSVAGLFLALSVPRFLRSGIGKPIHIADINLLGTLATEVVLAAIWLPVLRRRGWTVGHLARAYENLDVLRGVCLACAAWVAYVFAYNIVVLAWPGFAVSATAFRLTGTVSWPTAMGLIVLNPIFEESLYEGYIANALRRSGWAVALGASTALRLALHLYQGPIALVSILPTGVIFTGYYLRTRRLWPLIASHMLLDAIAIAPLAHGLA